MSTEDKAVVIDVGSRVTKAGRAGDSAPKAVFDTVIGTPRQNIDLSGTPLDKDHYVGAEARAKRGILQLKYPVNRGLVDDWEGLEKIYQHAFSQLGVEPQITPVFVADTASNPPEAREKIAEILFEIFKVPKIYIAKQAVLSVFATGRLTGVVVESGDGVTQVVPVFNGLPVTEAIGRVELAGTDLTDYLFKISLESGNEYNFQTARDAVQEMKEAHCYVTLDYESELTKDPKSLEVGFKLLDDSRATISTERFRCPEAMFKPKLMNSDLPSLPTLIHEAIGKCNEEQRQELYANIVLSGGNTQFPGLADRLKKEVSALAPGVEVGVSAPAAPAARGAWIGGSIMTSLPQGHNFQTMWVTVEEYQEKGASAVKKCY